MTPQLLEMIRRWMDGGMNLEIAARKIGESPKHLAEALKLDPPQRPNLTPPWVKEGGDAA